MTLTDFASMLTSAGINCTLTDNTLQSNISWKVDSTDKHLSLFLTKREERYIALINTPVKVMSSGLSALDAVQTFIREVSHHKYEMEKA